MSNIPPIIIDLLEGFFEKTSPEISEQDMVNFKVLLDRIICAKWLSDYPINAPLHYITWRTDQYEDFTFKPVPKLDKGLFGEGLKLGTHEFDEYLMAVSTNFEKSEIELKEFLRLMRAKSGKMLQKNDWDKRRMERAVDDITKEKAKK